MRSRVREHNLSAKMLNKIQAIIYQTLPILNWLPMYNKHWLLGDTIAGITVGIMVVPQALSYALIANLPVQYGLYTATVGAMIYCLFGTAKDINVGPITMLSLLTGQVVIKISNTYDYSPQEVAITLAFMTGAILLLLGVLRLGIILEFISTPVSIGFSTGAALSIMITQIPSFLGVDHIDKGRMPVLIIIDSCKALPNSKWVDPIFGVLAVVVLVGLDYIKTSYGSKHFILRFIGTARNAIVISIFTVLSFIISKFEAQAKFSIIGDVPSGLQPPRIPNLSGSLLSEIGASSAIAVLLGLMEHFGVCKSMGCKNMYTADNNQELIGLGFCNIVGSVFSGYCASGSFSRGAVNAQSNVQTPLSGLLTGAIAIFSLLFLPKAFYYIPEATLAAIIIVSMTGLVTHPRGFWHIWEIDKTDFVVAAVSGLATFFVKIQVGILMGISSSLLVLLYRLARPHLNFSTDTPTMRAYSEEVPPELRNERIVVLLQESLLFPNVEYFRRKARKAILHRCSRRGITRKEMNWSQCKPSFSGSRHTVDAQETEGQPKAIIFDMSHVNQIDYSGVQCMQEIKSEIDDLLDSDEPGAGQPQVYFTGVNPVVQKKLQAGNLLTDESLIFNNSMHTKIHKAPVVIEGSKSVDSPKAAQRSISISIDLMTDSTTGKSPESRI